MRSFTSIYFTVNVLVTDLTPSTARAVRSAAARNALLRTVPLSVTVPARVTTAMADALSCGSAASRLRTAAVILASGFAGVLRAAGADDDAPPLPTPFITAATQPPSARTDAINNHGVARLTIVIPRAGLNPESPLNYGGLWPILQTFDLTVHPSITTA
jgi:hypothetical protein